MSKKNSTGMIGLMVGFLALGIAIIHFWEGPFNEPAIPTLELSIADKAINFKNALKSKLTGEEVKSVPKKSNLDIDKIIDIVTIIIGFIAIIFGVLSFIKKEEIRLSGSAILLGSSAIAFHFLISALAVAFIILLLIAIVGDFS